MKTLDMTTAKEIYTVTQLNQETRSLLEHHFAVVWVEGEISNFIRSSANHCYFVLKDDGAQIRCAFFQRQNNALSFQPKDGMHVIAKVQVSLYAARGDFQLIVHTLEEIGFGALQRAFENLKKKLSAEGLFAEQYKKPIPPVIQTIGIVTSPTGAALQDILSVLKRRAPHIAIIIYPTLVQGDQAAAGIVHALGIANQHHAADILILARGGGSIEDLWPFNEEKVARAIFKSRIPIISGVGHEIDFTIADFVADKRGATPSAAAELVSPHVENIVSHLHRAVRLLHHALKTCLKKRNEKLQWVLRALEQQHPARRLALQKQQADRLQASLLQTMKHILYRHQTYFSTRATALNTLSPLATLARGYAIATRATDHVILKDSQQVKKGDRIEVKLSKGQLKCRVD